VSISPGHRLARSAALCRATFHYRSNARFTGTGVAATGWTRHARDWLGQSGNRCVGRIEARTARMTFTFAAPDTETVPVETTATVETGAWTVGCPPRRPSSTGASASRSPPRPEADSARRCGSVVCCRAYDESGMCMSLLLLDQETCQFRPRANAELCVNPREICFDCLGRHYKCGCDLLVG
jgi:hypothetical protein